MLRFDVMKKICISFGIDFHKNYSFITEMNEYGVVLRQFRLSNNRDNLKAYLIFLPMDSKIAIEATCNWYYFYELVEEHDFDIYLAHPLKTKAIASARLMKDVCIFSFPAHTTKELSACDSFEKCLVCLYHEYG